jgi:hypothetical protein
MRLARAEQRAATSKGARENRRLNLDIPMKTAKRKIATCYQLFLFEIDGKMEEPYRPSAGRRRRKCLRAPAVVAAP